MGGTRCRRSTNIGARDYARAFGFAYGTNIGDETIMYTPPVLHPCSNEMLHATMSDSNVVTRINVVLLGAPRRHIDVLLS